MVDPDNSGMVIGAAALVSLGSLASALWAILRLNTSVKERGASEQKIIDRLDGLEKQQGRLFNRIEELSRELTAAEKRGTTEHGNINKTLADTTLQITREMGSMSERMARLETGGCKPAKDKAS